MCCLQKLYIRFYVGTKVATMFEILVSFVWVNSFFLCESPKSEPVYLQQMDWSPERLSFLLAGAQNDKIMVSHQFLFSTRLLPRWLFQGLQELPLLKSYCSYGPISHTTIWMESPPTGYYPCMAARLHRCHPPTSVNSILRFHVSIVTTSRID